MHDPYRDWELVMLSEVSRTDGIPKSVAIKSDKTCWLTDVARAHEVNRGTVQDDLKDLN